MFGRKKEKEVKKLIMMHLEKVSIVLNSMQDSVKFYLDGKIKEAKESGYQTHLVEEEADSLRREIIEKLHKGAFLPAFREDLIGFVAQQDKIADRSESCCDFFLTQRPEVPEEFIEKFNELLQATVKTFSPYKEAIVSMFEDYEVVKRNIKNVNTFEEEADTVEWHLTRDIFSSKLDLARKIHLRQFVFHIVEVSDVIEDAADNLDIFIVKYQV
ncbi:MAG: TIGR00153 family protein [Elusimicrobia bacterium]|nr:TIGR00153 family protein [Elusimicrobiota bacterium]